MHEWPIINTERCYARNVQFAKERAMIEMADGRIIGVPLHWFPPIQCATNEQRQNFISFGDTVNWTDIDDGIDLTAMLTGLYIVPVYQRNSRAKPHKPATWIYLEDGVQRTDGDITAVPFVQDTRNIPDLIRFTDDHIVFELADGRALFLPISFSPQLAQASSSQRQNYQLKGLTVRWEDLEESIDLITMLTGFYDLDAPRPTEAIKATAAAT